jgi:hypothetical protein
MATPRVFPLSAWLLVATAGAALAACEGFIGDAGDAPGAVGGGAVPGADAGAISPNGTTPLDPSGMPAATSGLRRLTTHEFGNVLRDLLGDTSASADTLLPTDLRTPYDNDYTIQVPSQALIEGVELLARNVVDALMADTARRDKVVGCKPSGPGDQACFTQFLTTFGRKALRRSLSQADVTAYLPFQQLGVTAQDFFVGVGAAIEAFLNHPELVYRIEIGTPVAGQPGVFQLGDFEVAQRLSFLLWETTPDDALLDQAQAGHLSTGDDVRAAATRMLADPRARDVVNRFHAQWLGYEGLPFSAELSSAMQVETKALVDRVVFDEKRPWQDLFRMNETYVSDLLATNYGLPLPGSSTPKWVSYGTTGRKGILSQGSFLSNGARVNDTSPTLRGKAVRNRLLCQKISPPPPTVNVDNPPPGTANQCKIDRYKVHEYGGCAGCHGQMDPIGFGLENYDAQGRYRAAEPVGTNPCPIDGNGSIEGIGTFHGPAELSDLLLKIGMNRCIASELYKFAVGKKDDELDDADNKSVDYLITKIGGDTQDFAFNDLLLTYLGADAFRYRQE